METITQTPNVIPPPHGESPMQVFAHTNQNKPRRASKILVAHCFQGSGGNSALYTRDVRQYLKRGTSPNPSASGAWGAELASIMIPPDSSGKLRQNMMYINGNADIPILIAPEDVV
eukprot:3089938-Pyramimonas_sp.AAC.1